MTYAMTEEHAAKLLDRWKATWSDAPQPLFTHLNEIYRLLIELHCPERCERARQALLLEAQLARTCPDCES